MKNTAYTYVIVILSAILLGISFGFLISSIFTALGLIMLLGITAIIFIIILFGSAFMNQAEGTNYGLMGILFVLIFFCCFGFAYRQKTEGREQHIITKLEVYKKQHGVYPKDLKTIFPNMDSDIFTYNAKDSSFELSYSRDGWHRAEYNYERKEWYVTD